MQSYQSAKVNAGGGLAAWSTISGPGDPAVSTSILQRLSSLIASDQLFAIGGAGATGTPVKEATSNTYNVAPLFKNLNSDPNLSTDANMATVATYAALVFSSAHLYLLGGTVDGTAALPRVWTIVY